MDNSAVGGASTGSGGGGTTTGGAAVTETEACVRYVEGWCEQRVRCGLYSDFPFCMLRFAGACPDLLFAEGSSRTVEDVLECAETWQSWHCNVTISPPCAMAGSAALGDPCINGSQCESGTCSGSILLDECGTCLQPKAVGEACESGDPCESGATCDTDTHVCTLSDLPEEDPEVVPRPAGGICQLLDVCEGGYYCAFPPEGGTLECVPIPDERVGAGAPCSGLTAPCEDGTQCYCTDEDCTARRCFSYRKVGESCDDVAALCHGAATCASGVCVAYGTEGLFEALCGP